MSRPSELRREMYEGDPGIQLSVSKPAGFASLFLPRVTESNKGLYGHVLVIAGGRGKTGAAAMAGIAALRAGAGLVHGGLGGIGDFVDRLLRARDHDGAAGGDRCRIHRHARA